MILLSLVCGGWAWPGKGLQKKENNRQQMSRMRLSYGKGMGLVKRGFSLDRQGNVMMNISGFNILMIEKFSDICDMLLSS
jgi:hypothetical protein